MSKEAQAGPTGRIIIISGPSAVGKGSVNGRLFTNPALNLVYSVSMTTRQPRAGEESGKNYFFVSRAEFEQAIANNELIEHAEFVGNYYGTPRRWVEEQIAAGKNVVLEIEVNGATQVLRREKNALSIFLMPPNLAELACRIHSRKSESDEVIKQRLDKALLEIPLKHNYKYIVENDDIDNAVAKITDIMALEHATTLPGPTVYEQLREIITAIVEEEYMFFVDNWEENVRILSEKKQVTLQEFRRFDPKKEMIDLLTTRLYLRILAHGRFSDLLDKEFVRLQVQRLMFKIDFFKIRQNETTPND